MNETDTDRASGPKIRLNPANYSAVIEVDGRTMFVCARCGSLVHSRKAHNEFHDETPRATLVGRDGGIMRF